MLSLFEEGSKEYNEIDYRIMCIQYLQQECIDSAKNGIPPKPIPSYWNNYNSDKLKIKVDEETGEILNTEEELEKIELYSAILTEKKPYYFRYIYKASNDEYVKYIKAMEVNCLRNFRKSIDELKAVQNKTEEEKDFLKYYEKHLPLSNNPCVVNKIANKVENVFDGDLNISIKEKSFDYTIYMTDNKHKATQKQKAKLVELYEEHKKAVKVKFCVAEQENKDSRAKSNYELFEIERVKAMEIITDEEVLANTLIEMSYKSTKISRAFVWNLVGDVILANLLKKNKNTIHYPVKDNEGDIVFNGNRFRLETKTIEMGE